MNNGARMGAGYGLLTETVISPTLAHQLQQLLDRFPAAKWHQYEPVNRSHAWEGARLAFGEYVETQYRFDEAAVILALDADFLSCEPDSVRYAHDFAARRRVWQGPAAMSRLYAVESSSTNTGAMADHRLPLRPSEIGIFALALAQELGIEVGPDQASRPPLTEVQTTWTPRDRRRSAWTSGLRRRHRWSPAAGRRACAGACHESRPGQCGQHGVLH